MSIDRNDGTVGLPSGHSISPSLSQQAFRQTALFQEARSQDYGTLPWIHYHFSGGVIEGRKLLASLCFYDQILIYVSLIANLYAEDVHDWSSYSLDVEAATKDFHDRILEQILGAPTARRRVSVGQMSPEHLTLACPVTWQFSWGLVGSGHDFKGGITSICVRYGNRHEEANRAYRSGRG
jgi:hypothetical protein